MEEKIVHANATKRFFIDMITRDISLEDAILDLIDNSTDSYIRTQGTNISSDFLDNLFASSQNPSILSSINIDFSSKKFTISDKCGGIDKEDAINHVFIFGREDSDENETTEEKKSYLSVYGIGLKRAIFKIGKKIKIETRTINNGIRVKIDVDKWRKDLDPNWNFPYEDIEKASSPDDAGTSIIIEDLNDEVIMRLNDGMYINNLHGAISSTYTYFLNRYIKIKLNGLEIPPKGIPIGDSERAKTSYNEFEKDSVKVQLIAGLARRDRPWAQENSGWYVLCNGRAVVFADRTELTGWGSDYGIFVPKYRGFIGIAMFSAADPEKLPWTTTKRGLNKESKIYQHALNKMALITKPILNFLSNMYSGSREDENPVYREIAESVQPADMQSLVSRQDAIFEVKIEKKLEKITEKVSFDANITDLNKVRKCLNKSRMSNKEIGKKAFDYFLKQECSDDN